MLRAEYLGRFTQTYVSRKSGETVTSHYVSVFLPTGEAGKVYLPEQVYRSLDGLSRGDEVQITLGARVYNGEVRYGVTAVEAV